MVGQYSEFQLSNTSRYSVEHFRAHTEHHVYQLNARRDDEFGRIVSDRWRNGLWQNLAYLRQA